MKTRCPRPLDEGDNERFTIALAKERSDSKNPVCHSQAIDMKLEVNSNNLPKFEHFQ